MALLKCPNCGTRMSDQWPSCPACGVDKSGARPRKRINALLHYLLATTLTTIGALIFGAQVMGRSIPPAWSDAALGMIVVGAAWYAAVRLLVMIR